MVVVRNLFILVLVGVLVFGPALRPVAEATVGTGAITNRNVFTLTAAGAAKLGLAESQIAGAIKVLGMLGQVGSVIAVGFTAYQITTGLWDWWSGTYDPGQPYTVPSGSDSGTRGVQAGAGVGDCIYYDYATWGPNTAGTYGLSPNPNCPGAGYKVVGQTFTEWQSGTSGGYVVYEHRITYHYIDPNATSIPHTAVANAALTASGRAEAIAKIDAGIAALSAVSSADTTWLETHPSLSVTGGVQGALQMLQAGRDVISNGVALVSTDISATNAAGSVGTLPGAIPATGETTAPPTGATDAGLAAAAAGIVAAVSASGAAVVSAVSTMSAAVSASIAASQAAVVSAVSTMSAAVSASIAASQAAVVSAVAAVVAPIVAAIGGSQSAVVDAIHAIPQTGGQATTDAVNALKTQEAAQSAAADEQAAAHPAPAVVCPVCTRAAKWSDAWIQLRDAGQAAPVFGLINRIVINPTGTIERVRTVQTTNFGLVRFDLSAWGIDTYIGVVRYVVIFAALMAGYFVIFG